MNELTKYARIKQELLDQLTRDLAVEKIRPGDMVCSETDIIATYEVSPTTAKRVLNDLVHEGKIYRVQGKGSFLADWQASGKDDIDRPKTIGLIIPGVTFSFYADMVYGCETAARGHGYRVVLCNATDTKKEADYLRKCLDDRVDGIIIAVTGVLVEGEAGNRAEVYNSEMFAQICTKIPMVVVDQIVDGIEADCVINDNVAGAMEAVQHLVAIGRRKIVHLAGPSGMTSADGRLEGYRTAIQGAGLEFDESMIKRGDFFENVGHRHLNALLAEKKEFDAVFACDDKVATGAYRALLEHGLKVPEDVAVVGFANETEPLMQGLRFTTVDQYAEKLGSEAMDLLAHRIDRTPGVANSVVKTVSTRLVVRESTMGTLVGTGTVTTEDRGSLAVGGTAGR